MRGIVTTGIVANRIECRTQKKYLGCAERNTASRLVWCEPIGVLFRRSELHGRVGGAIHCAVIWLVVVDGPNGEQTHARSRVVPNRQDVGRE